MCPPRIQGDGTIGSSPLNHITQVTHRLGDQAPAPSRLDRSSLPRTIVRVNFDVNFDLKRLLVFELDVFPKDHSST